MMWPWLRTIPWYRKVYRVFHCFMSSPMGYAVFLGYWIDDVKHLQARVDSILMEVKE